MTSFFDRASGLLLHHEPQQTTLADHLHGIAASIDGNPLVAALFASGLGSRLSPQEVASVVSIVTAIEGPRTPMADAASQPQPVQPLTEPRYTPAHDIPPLQGHR